MPFRIKATSVARENSTASTYNTFMRRFCGFVLWYAGIARYWASAPFARPAPANAVGSPFGTRLNGLSDGMLGVSVHDSRNRSHCTLLGLLGSLSSFWQSPSNQRNLFNCPRGMVLPVVR